MSHPAQQEFCREVKRRFPNYFRQSRVLEIGARNVNGSVRDEFQRCDYIGVDCHGGKGVDVVAIGHLYEDEPQSFDVVCSTETLEHDPYAEQTVARMCDLLRPEGLFLLTCAGVGRAEHGTTRTGSRYGPENDFYRNVSIADFLRWSRADSDAFSTFYMEHNRSACDLYFWGIKAASA